MISEEYYLSEKMTRYVLNVDGIADRGGWSKGSTVNPSIAHAITVKGVGGRQRCGVENYVVDGLPRDFPSEELVKILYGRETDKDDRKPI